MDWKRGGKKKQIQARAMSDWKRMRTCNWAVLRLLRCSHNCMTLNPQPGWGLWCLWGPSIVVLALISPRKYMLLNCCFGFLLPLFPLALVSYNWRQNCWELRRLSDHLLNMYSCAESHQSIWTAGKSIPAYCWEPWERQQLVSCMKEMVYSLETVVSHMK